MSTLTRQPMVNASRFASLRHSHSAVGQDLRNRVAELEQEVVRLQTENKKLFEFDVDAVLRNKGASKKRAKSDHPK